MDVKYKTFIYGREIPDLIIEDGETWIRVDDKRETLWSGLWPGIAYERLEVVRAKDYDPAGSTYQHSGRRDRGTYSRDSYTGAGSYHYLVDESGIHAPWDQAPIAEFLWGQSVVNPTRRKGNKVHLFPEWHV